ncbi:MAG: xanthine dehydrogenase family protein molybdopterin-binding subunit [Deltaproteobacteria bacterium]|nr:xanthine dehydrogenase family protein molybdopterin-binding subunit [Deltaproteobacteria bacterium]
MYIGKNINRIDGFERVTGRLKFIADYKMDNMLYGLTVRAPVAKGKLKGIIFDKHFNFSDITIVTASDIKGENIIHIIKDDMPCLVKDQIEYLGEPVALIAAKSLKMAYEALRHIKVEVEEETPIMGIEEIVKTYKREPDSLTYFYRPCINKGDVNKGFDEASYIVEAEFYTGFQEHLYLEPQGMLTYQKNGKFYSIGSLQCPYYVRPAVAKVLGIKEEDVIVIQAPTGGAFGGKEDFPSLLAAHTALLCQKSGKPVIMIYDREEDISFTTKRHPSYVHHKAGVMKEGRIIALESTIIFDAGAYTTLSPVVLSRGALHACSVYNIPNVRISANAIKSNVPPTGAFRGFGAPQTLFAMESFIDTIAHRLKLSPYDIRKKNLIKTGSEMATGQKLTESVAIDKCLDRLINISDFKKKYESYKKQSKSRETETLKGIGIATVMHGASFTGSGELILKSKGAIQLNPDGTIEILIANTDMGQGVQTIFPQIVASKLNIPIELVRCPLPDTSRVPNSGPTVASRTTMIVGRIISLCCDELLSLFEKHFKDSVKIEKGFLIIGKNKKRIPFKKAAESITNRKPLYIEKQYDFPPDQVWDETDFKGTAYPVYSWGAIAVEIEVNKFTFEVRPINLYSVYEIGKAINPKFSMGQLEGGSIQALGYGLIERCDLKNGKFFQNRLQTYIIPTSEDIPEMKTVILEEPYSRGPFGAKGLGELPHNGVAPAIRNAILNALSIEINEIPITPEVILKHMKNRGLI